MKAKLIDLLLQIIPVMIGVFLGFIVSDWNTERENKKKTKILVSNIITEVEYNKGMIEGVLRYHEMLRDSSRHYMSINSGFKRPSYFSGVNTLTLANNAFESGIQTGLINELPLSKLQGLNMLYNNQKEYNEFTTILLSGLITMDLNDSPESTAKFIRYLSLSMTDIAIKEKNLLNLYQETLASLKNQR